MLSVSDLNRLTRRSLFSKAVALAIVATALPASAEGVSEPDGYRGEPYRAPVPDTLAGATVLTTEMTHELWGKGAARFIDVLPRTPRPANLPEGTIWRDKPRNTIPGSMWLPNVGYQAIPDVDRSYFLYGLEKATGGDRSIPLVIFCLEECWMSWNAAKRALEFGYSSVHWYPEGTDGWTFHDHPVERVEPERRPD
jgi:PQQ-dependent catabolism-associated CXXCW motif protein